MDELSLYDYSLPDELIARRPLPQRDASRMLVVNRAQGTIEHQHVTDLPGHLSRGDALVFNNTRVVPARLTGVRAATGGRWEGLFLSQTEDGNWRLIGQTRGRLQPGELLSIHPAHQQHPEPLQLRLIQREPEQGMWLAACESPGDTYTLLEQYGTVPLPPYINRPLAEEDDWTRYQTTFASRPGAVAAPTAGLHFTPQLLEQCSAAGVRQEFVTLHTGIGTFRPVSASRLSDHSMHREWCELSAETATRLNEARAAGGRVIAVGTTSVRTLESAALAAAEAAAPASLAAYQAETELFIRPPWQFRAIDGLLTNFHLPRSTLLVMISALAGRELILAAYEEAIRERYRFFSYGDAMLII
ncbi:MAG: tRNA preQ1(34) S-adenosylmethionine ribosyltransferase-isomerase QueA [Planctomycetaceae bacterium]|nr:tRNA preQ1(34) S-adenosylmethionine ribosyltransferase-isomerase QueA [Planctomycetaceae bacterium]